MSCLLLLLPLASCPLTFFHCSHRCIDISEVTVNLLAHGDRRARVVENLGQYLEKIANCYGAYQGSAANHVQVIDNVVDTLRRGG